MAGDGELASVVRSRVSERLKRKGNYQVVEKGVARPPRVFFRPEEVLEGTAMRGSGENLRRDSKLAAVAARLSKNVRLGKT